MWLDAERITDLVFRDPAVDGAQPPSDPLIEWGGLHARYLTIPDGNEFCVLMPR